MPNPLTKSIRLMRTISSRVIAIGDGQDEMFRRLDGLEGRIGAIEGRIGAIEGRIGAIEGRIGDLSNVFEGRLSAFEVRLDDLSNAIQIRHVDLWKLVEERHSEMWKLITDVNNSLPMTVAMSTSESSRKLSDAIRSDIADTRQQISAAISKVVIKNE